MPTTAFPAQVAKKLGFYVYRLIDPRSGETFYVGKGRDQRVFHHVQEQLSAAEQGDDDAADLKLRRVAEIRAAGLEVIHLIHRHGLDEATAFAVEAALIDAFPGATNKVGGHGSDEFGCRHAEQIIRQYQADEFAVDQKIVLITIRSDFEEPRSGSIYDACRGSWKMSLKKARDYGVVLAQRDGLVVGVFAVEGWYPATPEHFHWLSEPILNRIGFVGNESAAEVRQRYIGKRMPAALKRRGAVNPIRYLDP